MMLRLRKKCYGFGYIDIRKFLKNKINKISINLNFNENGKSKSNE